MTSLDRHVSRWEGCTRCTIASHTKTKVFYRGECPCDLLIIGEAPGDVELTIGKPFIGPAGRFLNILLRDAKVRNEIDDLTIGFTNAIACAPVIEGTTNLGAPSNGCIKNCSDRLYQCIEMANPYVILTLGNTAKKAMGNICKHFDFPVFHAIHPSAVLRQGERGSLDKARLNAVLDEAFQSVRDQYAAS